MLLHMIQRYNTPCIIFTPFFKSFSVVPKVDEFQTNSTQPKPDFAHWIQILPWTVSVLCLVLPAASSRSSTVSVLRGALRSLAVRSRRSNPIRPVDKSDRDQVELLIRRRSNDDSCTLHQLKQFIWNCFSLGLTSLPPRSKGVCSFLSCYQICRKWMCLFVLHFWKRYVLYCTKNQPFFPTYTIRIFWDGVVSTEAGRWLTKDWHNCQCLNTEQHRGRMNINCWTLITIAILN